jgi:hypothetical protein
MQQNMKPILNLIWLYSLIAACGRQQAVSTSFPTLSVTPIVSPTPEKTATPVAMTSMECATSFKHRELKEPYKRDVGEPPRYTLSTEELKNYLAVMGIEALCVPQHLGSPFINVDWDGRYISAKGRMLSIGFEALYHGSGWSDVYLIYATYDFTYGSEYDTFARPEDRDAVRQSAMPDMIEVDGFKGFIYYQVGYYEGSTSPVRKAFVIPFENDYVAVVFTLWDSFPNDDEETIIQKLKAGEYPPDRLLDAQAWDILAQSIQFQPLPQP